MLCPPSGTFIVSLSGDEMTDSEMKKDYEESLRFWNDACGIDAGGEYGETPAVFSEEPRAGGRLARVSG